MAGSFRRRVNRQDARCGVSRPAPVRKVAISLAIAVNLIVAVNAARHPPQVGYDASGHLAYARVLASGRLPLLPDTPEYFSAPLPYVPIAAALALGLPMEHAAKLGQFSNVAASALLTAALLALCGIVHPGDDRFAVLTVGLTCLLPVYAKSFSQVRGEPWVAATSVVLVVLLLRAAAAAAASRGAAAVIGLVAATVVLSRQWGVLAVGGACVWTAVATWGGALSRALVRRLVLVSLPLLVVGGGWYYASLAMRTGNPVAFNQSPHPLARAADLRSFLLGTGSGALFTSPIRPAFPSQLLPILQSEIWGDYWCYFLVSGHHVAGGKPASGPTLERTFLGGGGVTTNRDRIASYLGRLNLLGLPVSLLLLAGGGFGLVALGRLTRAGPADPAQLAFALAGAVAAVSIGGYLGFLILFPTLGKGDTIKATYILQVFPMLAVLAAELVFRLRSLRPRAYRWCLATLVVIAVHAVPALFTRY